MNLTEICDDLCDRFPEHAGRIRELAMRDTEFRAICEDYGESLLAAAHWAERNAAGAEKAEEFRQIAADLRDEVVEYVKTEDRK
jgi:hypothetical protein